MFLLQLGTVSGLWSWHGKPICHVTEVNKCPEQQTYATTGRREHAKIGRAEEKDQTGIVPIGE